MDDMERLPVSRSTLLAILAAAAVVLFFAGRYLTNAGTAEPSHGTARVAPAPAAIRQPPVVVHVVGAVRRPGLYHLRQGGRIADAVRRAGGPTRAADVELVNLAAPLADGEQVVVPRHAPAGAATGSGHTGAVAAATPSGPVHLSTATVEDLDVLPGVGPVTAQRIVDYRTAHGAFSSVDELDAVPGIGPARLDQLRDLVAP